jgi:hypothetical protein
MENSNVTREQWLSGLVEELRPVFQSIGHGLPDRIRVTCGFPSKAARSDKARRIGEHWSPKASDDQTHEILISPVIDDPVEAAAILVHELAHAATDGDGHKGRFPRVVTALHLEGKPSATFAGDAFKAEFGAIIDSLGAYPHARLNVSGRKVQSTRLLKASCPTCGYTVRVTQKWAQLGLPVCPTDGATFSI